MIAWTKEREKNPQETQKTLVTLFNKSDANGDGKLDLNEFATICKELENLVRDKCGDAVTLNKN